MQKRHDVPRRVIACLFLGLAVNSHALHATPAREATVTSIAWETCTADLVDTRWADLLGDRLECGRMLTPVEEDTPAKGSFTVGLVRVKAEKQMQREGSIFFNFGGPGANPLNMLPPTAALWGSHAIDHPLDGDKKRLAERFDLVAVIPRGLRGGTRFPCRPGPEISLGPDPTVYLSDWNWAGLVRDAKAYAAACSENPLQRWGGTLQHARDMEHARLALDEPVMNFVGISYGTWVGAYYASMYPNHVGRMVMDSVMNYAGTFEEQTHDFAAERQALFARSALRPVLANPLIYGLGTDAATVMARFRNMPYQARGAWKAVIGAPAHLSAALTVADWIREQGEPDKDRLAEQAAHYVFSPDPTVDSDIKVAAAKLIPRLGQPDDPTLNGVVDPAVYYTVVCGDTPWRTDAKALRLLANTIARKYAAVNGNAIVMGLVCTNWSSLPRWRPPVAELAKAPPILMIQAEFDPATVYSGAMKAFHATPGAHLVLARGAGVHGLFGLSATPCIERSVARFLLNGELPASRLTSCDFVPSSPPSEPPSHAQGLTDGEILAELVQRLRAS